MAESGKTRDGKDQVEIAERRRKALDYRKAGMSYPDIARQMGLSGPGSAYKIVQKALKATYQEPADDVRKLEIERLDRMQLALWPLAMGTKDRPPDLQAFDRILKIQAMRAALLGLDARTQIQVEQHRDYGRRLEALENGGQHPGPALPPRTRPASERGDNP